MLRPQQMRPPNRASLHAHMTQSSSQSNPLPRFERPSEAVVYWTLENLCGGAGGRYMLPLAKLAKHCGLSVSTVNRAALSLVCRGVIKYRPGQNQSRPSIFEIPLNGGEKLSSKAGAQRKIGKPISKKNGLWHNCHNPFFFNGADARVRTRSLLIRSQRSWNFPPCCNFLEDRAL